VEVEDESLREIVGMALGCVPGTAGTTGDEEPLAVAVEGDAAAFDAGAGEAGCSATGVDVPPPQPASSRLIPQQTIGNSLSISILTQ